MAILKVLCVSCAGRLMPLHAEFRNACELLGELVEGSVFSKITWEF
jgi:hypothetical protein